MEAFEYLLKVVGAFVLAGGGLSLIIYKIFKHLGVKWLDARFDERLQRLKHDHDKEIENLRFRIAALLDRATKLHNMEFEVLPQAWAKLNDAFWSSRSMMSAMQSHADLDRMSGPQLEEFLQASKLFEWQKDEIRSTTTKRNEVYWKFHVLLQLTEAYTKSHDAYVFTVRNGIFLHPAMREKFDAIHDLIWKAQVEHRINEEHDVRPRNRKDIDALLSTDADAKLKDLERELHERLWIVADDANAASPRTDQIGS